ncbi:MULTISPECIES: hypothetical protein [unclassified Beijerinckia]|uniref:hypothetical protein n=1 Tax=unclassified Beijerinckia TaxID=2638183 RepID=UPI0008962ACB|nr:MULTISPECIES: hypothetical protein [unclassified Beijerinckia]MDH7797797.1 hypothetical protein [Beijerinckia sp. GAS462]SEC98901.1 hypothetical protein SAMN05443249_4087 [Beijerinckia sp. 28-YEA-48]
MKTSIAVFFAFAIASVAGAQAAPCSISKEKAATLRPGATLESIQNALGCKLQQQSSSGFGETAQDIYGIQDDGGNRLFVLMGKNGRLVRTNYQPRQLNPADPLAPKPAPQAQQQRAR